MRRKSFGLCLLKLLLGLTASLAAGADVLACQSQESTKTEVENVTPEPAAVAVHPEADDAAIARRLASILEATEWFDKIHVEVNEGVVTLRGGADSVPHRDWAASLARKTEDVVAVVNNLVVREAPLL
ncbi:MAG TPA: BON domain-containing protein, partial [Planctomycetota bacterium]|nr:BON domain-containing protein [Planctomycetota bacterium]